MLERAGTSGARRRVATLTVAAVAAALTTSCDVSALLGTGPDEARIVDGDVRVTLTIEPESVTSSDTLTATLRYENLGAETVVVTSAYGCLSFAGVYHREQRIAFPETDYGCTAAISSHELSPDDPLVMQWRLPIGGHDGVALTPATYRFVADLNTHRQDLERTFVVR